MPVSSRKSDKDEQISQLHQLVAIAQQNAGDLTHQVESTHALSQFDMLLSFAIGVFFVTGVLGNIPSEPTDSD